MKTIEELKQELFAANKLANEASERAKDARRALEEAMIAAYPFKVSDRVRISRHGSLIGEGIIVGFESYWGSRDYVKPIVHKIKNDGTASKVGKIFLWYDDLVEPAAVPEAETEKVIA